MKSHLVSAALAACMTLCVSSSGQAATITFATYPGGTQVPASDVSTGVFSPTSVMGDQFAALGIHFNDTGLLLENTFLPDGGSTHADGWCPSGGYSCAPNNIVLLTNNSAGTGIDVLRMTFDVPQHSIRLDIDDGYRAESTTATLLLSGGLIGPAPVATTLTEADELSACPTTQTAFQLCGRFQISAPAGKTFTELDVQMTTADRSPAACTQVQTDPNCGGSLIDNITFNSPFSAPEPSSLALAVAGLAGTIIKRRRKTTPAGSRSKPA